MRRLMAKRFPIILSTWSFGTIANAAGWPVLARGGKSIDAVEQACIAVESDPQVDSVGIGGTPDAEGKITLDGSIMLSPQKSAGVACIRHYAHPVSIARKVMEKTPHKLLVGEGAEEFAAVWGFKKEKLLTPEAMAWWKKWTIHQSTISIAPIAPIAKKPACDAKNPNPTTPSACFPSMPAA